jgi:hypothetical protein
VGGGLLIYAQDAMRMVRKQELENSIDETLWVEINKCIHDIYKIVIVYTK